MTNKYNKKKGSLDSLHDFDEGPENALYDDAKQTQLAAKAFERDNIDEDQSAEHAMIRKMILRGESLPDNSIDSKWDKFSMGE